MSTVLSLFGGLYAPWAGAVRLAGQNPRSLDDEQRRALIGFVSQSVSLLPGTATDNVTLADPDLGPVEVQGAAEIAGADRFIAALPDGYATILSDAERGSGVQLSAGQRQLLALARALVRKPQVQLLDEATAVIDGSSEAAFRDALRRHVLPTGTSVLTVAHRLTTVKDADHLVFLSAGHVVEEGPPAQLLADGGRFADLVALEQAGWDWALTPG